MRHLLHLLFCLSLAQLSGCGGETPPRELPRRLALFQKPFSGEHLNGAPFDHDLPLGFEGGGDNGYILSWWGGKIDNVWNGHNGNDWMMPRGTPVYATARGKVVFAEAEEPFLCGDKGLVAALIVRVRHSVKDGEQIDSLYAHLDRIDVQEGDTVEAGEQLGISGMTGCTNGPHLHFEVVRMNNTNNGRPVRIDPFGWEEEGADPWELHPDGAQSAWLWKDGEAPDDGRRIEEVWGPGILR